MEVKAVFFDIDGTFFDHVHSCVLPETMQAVQLLHERGIKVCLCSGRAIEMARQLGVLQLFPWDGYVGGAGVSVYNEQMEAIYEGHFTEEQTRSIFTLGEKYDLCIHSHGQHEFMTKPLNSYTKQALEEFHCQIPPVRQWEGELLCAISAYGPKGYDWSLFDAIEGIEVQQPSDTCVDFIKQDTNKATGIQKMMAYWQLDPKDCIAFGDSMNDKQMIQEAGLGIVMGNGKEELKTYADLVIGNSDEPAIYETLKQLKLV